MIRLSVPLIALLSWVGVFSSSVAQSADGELLAGVPFRAGAEGWQLNAPPGEFEIQGDPPVLKFERASADRSSNPYFSQPVSIEKSVYEIAVTYRTDGRLAPTLLICRPGEEGKPPNPTRILRLSPSREWTTVRFSLRGSTSEAAAPLELRIYPGTLAGPRMKFKPLGHHEGSAEFRSVSIRKVPDAPALPATVARSSSPQEIVYKETPGLPLHLLINVPFEKKPRQPLFVLVHGGGWSRGAPKDMQPLAQYFAARGYPSISPQYRLAGKGGDIDATTEDLLDAVEWARVNADAYGWDARRMFFVGASAGGHLGAYVAQRVPEAVGFIGMPGMYDLVNRGDSLFGHSSVFLKGTAEEQWRHGSPIAHLRNPPVASLLIHGEQDPVIDRQQAIDFANAIRNAGGDAEAFILLDAGHSVPVTKEVSEKIDQFVEQHK